MKVINNDVWKTIQKNAPQTKKIKDALSFIERWADAMEVRVKRGEKFPALVDAALEEANTENKNQEHVDLAFQVLTSVWVYKDQLKLWYLQRILQIASPDLRQMIKTYLEVILP